MSIEENKQTEAHGDLDPAQQDLRAYEVSDEESTVFSAPEAHRDKVAKSPKLKKMIFSAVAFVTVVAIAITVAITLPPLIDENNTSSDSQIDPPMMSSSLFDNVDRVTLIREDAKVEFTLTTVTTVSKDDNGKEVTETSEEWALKDVDPSLTSYSTIDNTVTSFMQQHYTKKVSNDKNDGNDYGFDKPVYKVDFYEKGSDKVYFSLLIGGENPTKSGRYATTTLDNAVYFIAGVSEFYQYQKIATDFVEPESIPAISKDSEYTDNNFNEGTLVMCDKMLLSGKNFGSEYTVVSQDNDNITEFTSYKITSPVSRAANDENIGNIVALFSYGIDSDGCYSYTNTEADRVKFGLDNPDFQVVIYVGNIKRSLKLTLQDDGYYAAYYADCKTIMKINPSSVVPASYDRGDLFYDLLFIENITNASAVTVEADGEKITFDIFTEYDEEAQKDSLSVVKYKGNELTMLNFQNYYSYLTLITAVSYDEYDTSDIKPSTVLTITHKDGTSTVVKYFKITSARYQVETNGVKMGLISASDHNRVMKYARNVAEDKTYNAR